MQHAQCISLTHLYLRTGVIVFGYNRFIFTDIMCSSLQYMYIEGVVTFVHGISIANRAKRSIYNDNIRFEASRGRGRNLPKRPYRSLVRFCVTSISVEICFVRLIVRSYGVGLCISRVGEVNFHTLQLYRISYMQKHHLIGDKFRISWRIS